MMFAEFARYLIKRGAILSDVYRLDKEGRQAAIDAHSFLCSEMDHNGFMSMCSKIGRQFVVDNLFDLFFIKTAD